MTAGGPVSGDVAHDNVELRNPPVKIGGRAQTMFVDGVQEAQGADTDITGNLRTGIGHSERNANEGEIDNFEAADLAGVAASKRLLLGVGV